jgi:hypothetical protein
MKTPPSLLPDLETLTQRLTAAMDGHGSRTRSVVILDRKLPRFMSTFPNEIVTCQLPDGRKRRVFCKYEARHTHNSFGHRGGIAHETEVYRRVLHELPGFKPRCLGAHTDEHTGETWLLLEYVEGSVRVSDISTRHPPREQPLALVRCAGWIGRFHALQEGRVSEDPPEFLRRYNPKYYRGWMRRTAKFALPLRRRFPWLAELCAGKKEWFAPLLASPLTIIHGEFYSKTVLIRRNKLYFIDWESAAIAAGEIDLASLTEGKWKKRIVRQCVQAYQRARWPEGAPADFARRLDAARLYLHFRWLGEKPEWAVREKSLWRYHQLRAAAKRLKLLD